MNLVSAVVTTTETDNEYVNALRSWGNVNYIKGLKSDLEYLRMRHLK